MGQTYDIIGDIHGHADRLKELLHTLGYAQQEGRFAHPMGRKVVFLGDFVDRGPKIREVLQTVRAMVEGGNALAVMGNHEFNAIAYHTPDGKGGFLRPHTPEKVHQHEASLAQLADPMPEEWAGWIEWFRSLPPLLDLKTIRAVHASWDNDALIAFKNFTRLDDATLFSMARHDGALNELKEILLNGQEFQLPAGHHFHDRNGVQRSDFRSRWWKDLTGMSYRQAVFPESDIIPDQPMPLRYITRQEPYRSWNDLKLASVEAGVPFVESLGQPTPELLARISANTANRLEVVPISANKNTLVVAISDPFNFAALDELSIEVRGDKVRGDVESVIAPPEAIRHALKTYYPATEIHAKNLVYPADAPPVFFGHYWMPPTSPKAPLAPNLACLDFSAAKGGPMVAYRWDGEQVLEAGKFVAV